MRTDLVAYRETMGDSKDHAAVFDDSLDEVLPADIQSELDPAADESDSDNVDEYHAVLADVMVGTGAAPREPRTRAHTTIENILAELETTDTGPLPDAVGSFAEELFSQLVSEMDFEGRLVEAYASASLYCACKVRSVAVGPLEVANASPEVVSKNNLLQRVKIVGKTLNLDPAGFLDASHYIESYTTQLGIDTDVQTRAQEVLELTQEAGLQSGRSPTGQAAAAIYVAAREAGLKTTQQDIAKVANVSTVTIRNRYHEHAAILQASNGLPDDPEDAIDVICDILGLSTAVKSGAGDLVTVWTTQKTSSNEDTAAVVLPAVRVASDTHDEAVGWRLLAAFAGADRDTDWLRNRVTELS